MLIAVHTDIYAGAEISGSASKKELQTAAQRHRNDLASLEVRDPSFYAYLKQTDEDLLEFGDEEADLEDLSESDAEMGEPSDTEVLLLFACQRYAAKQSHGWCCRLMSLPKL